MEKLATNVYSQLFLQRNSKLPPVCLYLLLLSLLSAGTTSQVEKVQIQELGRGAESLHDLGTIAFAVVGRTQYAFDLFSARVPDSLRQKVSVGLPPKPFEEHQLDNEGSESSQHLQAADHLALASEAKEYRHTEGPSVNYNGQFTQKTAQFFKTQAGLTNTQEESRPSAGLLFVSERSGNVAEIFYADDSIALQLTHGLALHDKPNLVPGARRFVFAATEEPSGKSRQGWTATYTLDIESNTTKRLTPQGVTDYSPAVSPSGEWVAVASMQGHTWDRELKFLPTDIYVFKSSDGSHRTRVAINGGWPAWGPDGRTIYFHREDEQGWFGIFKVTLPDENLAAGGALEEVRITPGGLHCMTPAAAPSGRFLAVATRRLASKVRHVELFDLELRSFIKLTELINPTANHYNPFISPDSLWVGYHRCEPGGKSSLAGSRSTQAEMETPKRAVGITAKDDDFITGQGSGVANVEPLRSPQPGLAVIRVSGDFPVFSPSGHKIAMIPEVGLADSGVVVMNADGSDKRFVFRGAAFGLSWNPVNSDVLYTATGNIFQTEGTEVRITAISGAETSSSAGRSQNWRHLTNPGTGNNAFPSVSPDGQWIVFRSGRSGHKNLYIMDAEKGEDGYLQQLTAGAWTDTMANWSPDGQWIAFSSDRNLKGTFEIFLVHPDGSGLHKLFSTGTYGRANHPFFREDSKHIVFTSDYAGISAEPVSLPHQFQPYGDIFVMNIDGSGLLRLTHNAYEDGTPSWGKLYVEPQELSLEGEELGCRFRDDAFLDLPAARDLKNSVSKC